MKRKSFNEYKDPAYKAKMDAQRADAKLRKQFKDVVTFKFGDKGLDLINGYPIRAVSDIAVIEDLKCCDCGGQVEYYFVPDKVWDALFPVRAAACIICCAKRLNPDNPPDLLGLEAEIYKQRERFGLVYPVEMNGFPQLAPCPCGMCDKTNQRYFEVMPAAIAAFIDSDGDGQFRSARVRKADPVEAPAGTVERFHQICDRKGIAREERPSDETIDQMLREDRERKAAVHEAQAAGA
jgi:hypothetical protein